MNKLDEFKEFVRNNNYLVSYVRDNKKTWQEFYELYDMYGEDENIWKDYLKNSNSDSNTNRNNKTLNDLLDMAKHVDVDKVQSGITSLQKAISLFGDLFVTNKADSVSKGGYEPRPIYKRFDD